MNTYERNVYTKGIERKEKWRERERVLKIEREMERLRE